MARAIGNAGVRITNLKQFQAAIKAADAKSGRLMTQALKRAGTSPLLPRVKAVAAATVRTGAFAGGFKISARGSSGFVVNAVPYAAGAEWGLQGKWAGFRDRYPPAPGDQRGRFGWRAIRETEAELADAVYDELREFVTIGGWAHD